MNEYDSFAQSSDEGLMAVIISAIAMNMILFIVLVVPVVLGMWKIFTKAGKPGWAAIVPIYNLIILAEIVGKPVWWAILMLVPCVGVVMNFLLCIELAKRFGKDSGFGILLALFAPIMFPILGFGQAQYIPIGTEPNAAGSMTQM